MSLDLARIQAICFDVDGVLRDTDDQLVRRLTQRLWRARLLFPSQNPIPFARWVIMGLESPGNLVFELTDRFGLDGTLDRLYSWLHFRQHERKPAEFTLVPGVSDMLASLHARYPLAIITTRGEHLTQCFLDTFDLGQYFAAVATGLTCRHTKPFPDPLLWAAEQMGVAPQNCLMVGDTAVDIRAGRLAGAQTVGVLCGFGREVELRRAGADLILPTTAELPNAIQQQGS